MLQAKFSAMADAALEAANEMESHAKQVKGLQVDLSSLSQSDVETPNRSQPDTPAVGTTAHSSNSTIDS